MTGDGFDVGRLVMDVEEKRVRVGYDRATVSSWGRTCARWMERSLVTPFVLTFDAGTTTTAVHIDNECDIAEAVRRIGLAPPRATLVVVGGAGGLDPADEARVAALFDMIVPVVADAGAVAIDGGTSSGVMRLHGEARCRAGAGYPLVGVAAEGTVVLPGRPPPQPDAAPLDRQHTHLVLVPGRTWGSESPWIAAVATAVAGVAPSVTVVMNGGEIVYDDVAHSVAARRPIIAVDGSGRAADALAAAARGRRSDAHATSLVTAGRVAVVSADEPQALARAVGAALRWSG